jgi:phospholipase C
LIAQVYNAIRANQALWENSLLVVLYDEHGGFYDHVDPPPAIPPDGHTKTFAFNLYGVRVPALLISPWVDHGVISDTFDHTSLLAYAMQKWGLDKFGSLGNRVDAAATFAKYLVKRSTLQVSVARPIPLPSMIDNDLTVPLNPNQKALIGFSRMLETKTADVTGARGGDVQQVYQEIGQRLVSSLKSVDGLHQAVMDRLDAFLKARGAQTAKS